MSPPSSQFVVCYEGQIRIKAKDADPLARTFGTQNANERWSWGLFPGLYGATPKKGWAGSVVLSDDYLPQPPGVGPGPVV
jgi:hypothetical protein